ncbi:hypothetical protein V2G26_020545 [Clonostachys chloroleuca]
MDTSPDERRGQTVVSCRTPAGPKEAQKRIIKMVVAKTAETRLRDVLKKIHVRKNHHLADITMRRKWPKSHAPRTQDTDPAF